MTYKKEWREYIYDCTVLVRAYAYIGMITITGNRIKFQRSPIS